MSPGRVKDNLMTVAQVEQEIQSIKPRGGSPFADVLDLALSRRVKLLVNHYHNLLQQVFVWQGLGKGTRYRHKRVEQGWVPLEFERPHLDVDRILELQGCQSWYDFPASASSQVDAKRRAADTTLGVERI